MAENGVRLGRVQETLLIPLYGRAVENRKEQAVLRDARPRPRRTGSVSSDCPDP